MGRLQDKIKSIGVPLLTPPSLPLLVVMRRKSIDPIIIIKPFTDLLLTDRQHNNCPLKVMDSPPPFNNRREEKKGRIRYDPSTAIVT